MMFIYKMNVDRYQYSSVGHYNDPDMLEVGNGTLSYDENFAHFAVWCMMAAPLILGNDLRAMPDNVLKIVTDKQLIAIDQDPLGKAAKRVIKSFGADILARPLSDGSTAVCFFNKFGGEKDMTLSLATLINDAYVALPKAKAYVAEEVGGESAEITETLTARLRVHSARVFILKPKA